MIEAGKNIAVFGLGPGTIEPVSSLPGTRLFVKEKGPTERRSVFTKTGGYENLFDRNVPEAAKIPMKEMRIITLRGTDFTVPLPANEYFMIDYESASTSWEQRVQQMGLPVTTFPANLSGHDMQVTESNDFVAVNIEGTKYEFNAAVIDGTGVPAHLATKVESRRKYEDFMSEFLCYGTYRGSIPEGQMILAFGPAGGTSWAAPSVYKDQNGEQLVDVVFSGLGYKSFFDRFTAGDGRERLDLLVQMLKKHPDITLNDTPENVSYGLIRSQGIPKLESKLVYPVGEAAGAAKPLSGESFNRSLRSGKILVDSLVDGLSPEEYHQRLKKEWDRADQLALAHARLRIHDQRVNPIGRFMDFIGQRYEEKKFMSQDVADMEKLVIDGKMSPGLLLQLSRNRLLLNDLFKTSLMLAKIKALGIERTLDPEWSFPDIDNDPSSK